MSSDEDDEEHFNPDCHLTWEWAVIKLENETNLYIRDRIAAVEKTIESQLSENSNRDIQNLYTLQGFLYLKLYKTEDGRSDLAETSKQCFLKALKKCSEENTGYKSVIYGNLYLCSKTLNEKSQKEYHKLCLEMKKDLSDQFKYELCEMKGYLASHLHMSERGVTFKNEALSYKETASVYFGLALELQKKAGSMIYSENDQLKIAEYLEKAIEIDPNYFTAKLRLAIKQSV